MVPDIGADKKALDAFESCGITLGTDLEVSLHKRSNKYEAVTGLKYWTTVKDGHIGTDGRTSFFQYLVELRPDPALNGTDLNRNLMQLVKQAIKGRNVLKSYRWKAGTGDFTVVPNEGEGEAYFLPKGGHIHFGNLPFDDKIVYALDMLLAPLCLMLEDPLRAAMRRARVYRYGGGTFYGQLGGYRHSQKFPTWEYRTLPNFCKNDLLSVGFFDLAKAIAHEVVNNPGFIRLLESKARTLAPDALSFNFCLKEVFAPRVGPIFEILKTLSLLNNTYGQELLYQLYRYVKTFPNWPIESDMLVDFGLWDPTKEPPPKAVPAEEKYTVHVKALPLGPHPANFNLQHLRRNPVVPQRVTYARGVVTDPAWQILDPLIRAVETTEEDRTLREALVKAGKPGATIVPKPVALLIANFSQAEAPTAFDRLAAQAPKPFGLSQERYTGRKEAVRQVIRNMKADSILRNLSN